ncbi:DUF2007 domain-containing protein [Pedobacter sp. PAMC26386]|nr:DUF2007 domain-containing protein [Pedobacter sp. PAMC26386]
MDRIVVFKTFYNPIEANIVKTRLIDAGIQCFLTDENIANINALYIQAIGGVKLNLFAKDVELARSILSENISASAFSEIAPDIENDTIALTCPNCGSHDVGYVQPTRKRFNILTTVIALIFFVYPFYSKKVYHCFNCLHEY